MSSFLDPPSLPSLGGSRPDPARRSRDLFPLPVPAPLRSVSGLLRRSSQRWQRKVRIRETEIEAVKALNWMVKKQSFLHDEVSESLTPDPLQTEALMRIHKMAVDIGHSKSRSPSRAAQGQIRVSPT